MNLQPVIPISLSDKWNLISRTILPVISQRDVTGPGSSEAGLGDLTQSFFFSPKAPGWGGLIWRVGPALLAPIGREGFTTGEWAAGPAFVVLRQQSGWTYGLLANHLWSFAHKSGLPDVNLTDLNSSFFQPFLTKALGKGRTFTINLESTYDWERSAWNIPTNLTYTKVTKIGTQLISVAGGVRAYLAGPSGGPDWGLRFTFTLLYPR